MVELAFITDQGFARHTGAALHSALSHLPRGSARVLVLHDGPLDSGDVARLRRVAGDFGAGFTLQRVPENLSAEFPSGSFPRSVWFRTLLPELLPDADKVLYLDSDAIVTDDLLPLWETDLGRHPLGAVTNPFYPFMSPYPQRWQIEPADYFNSGVLLLNLAQMRAENTLDQVRSFARKHGGTTYPEQDALNVVCRGRWLRLHPRWNAQSTFFELAPHELPVDPDQATEAAARPAVIHYIGPFKPWQFLCRHPRQADYFENARQTPWGEPELEGRTLRNAILRQLPLAWISRWFRAERKLAWFWNRIRRVFVPTAAGA